MRKILIITPYCPFPPYKSGGIHALYNILKQNINFNNNIDLIYYDTLDLEAEKEIKKYVNKVIYIDLRKKSKLIRIKSLIKRIPYGVYQYDNNKLNLEEYDEVIFDQELSIGLVDSINCKNKKLMAYDSMSLFFERKSDMCNINIIAKIYNKLQSKYYKKLHYKNYKKFSKIYFVSTNDVNYEKKNKYFDKINIECINLGVDYYKFNKDLYKNNKKNKDILFTGIMSYAPNKDAAKYFIKNLMPKLIEKDNEIRFIIVGKNSDKELKGLENKNIIIKGFVDDIVKYIIESNVYISPLRFGTGMKNKILEAMSCSKAIVASSISIEGIEELKNKENIFIANTDEEWINSIIELINNKDLNKYFGEKCRKIIIENYSWEKAYLKLFFNK